MEIILSLANLLVFLWLAIPRLRALSWAVYVTFTLLLIAIIQAFVEGPRWQIVPAYVLAGLFFLMWLLGIALPGRIRVNRLVSILGVGMSALVLVISVALPVLLPVFHFQKPTGPYQVGTLTYHWVDTSRQEIFSTDPNAHRELMAQVWYPVKGDSSSARAPYVVGADAISSGATHALSSGGLVHLPGFFFDHFKYVTTNAIPSAPIAIDRPSYPVLVYLTGLDGFRQVSTFQVENLVSYGYIAVGIDQPYTSAAVTFPDGHYISGLTKGQVQPLVDQSIDPVTNAPKLNGQPLKNGIIPYLAQDVSFTLDQLIALDKADPNGILTGRFDMQRAGTFGVSLGAMVVGEACHRDQRLKACLMMDAAMAADVVQAGLKQPSIWMTRDANIMRLERQRSGGWSEAEIHQTLSTMQAVYAKSLPGDGYYVQITGMFHVNFTDAPYWSPFTSQLGLTGPINGQRGFDIVNAYSLAFFNKALEGQPSTLLNGPSKQYPEVNVEIQRH